MWSHKFVEIEQNDQLLYTKSENESLRKEMTQLKTMSADLEARNSNLGKENQEHQKIYEAELQKELEKLEERHNRLKADLEVLASSAIVFWIYLQEEQKAKMAAEENFENLLSRFREYKETQAEEQRTVEDLYRKALHTIERLKENADDEHGLNETGQSLHDEMEEAQALAVDEEMHSFMVLEGEEKDAEERSTNSVWRSFCRWFTSSLGISVKSASRLIKNNPNGLYDRRRCI